MADRFPLILNTSANQIQEIASGDTLDLSGNNIKGVGIITATNISGNIIAGAGTSNIVAGIVTAVTFKGDGDFVELDVDGHTNLDNVSISGITTTSESFRIQAANKYLTIGASNHLQLYNNNNDSFVKHSSSSGGLYMGGKIVSLNNQAASRYGVAYFENVGDARLYWTGTDYGIRIKTTQAGIEIPLDLDVDGHTNLDNLSVAGVSTFSSGITVTGNATVSGNLSVGGVLTYEDVTNVDSVGIITARAGIHCSTDGVGNGIKVGDGSDLIIQHNGTNSFIDNNTGDLYIQTTGSGDDILIESADDFTVKVAGSQTAIQATGGGAVELYHSGTKMLETTSIGLTISGDVKIIDNENLRLGTDNDMLLYHTNSHGYIENSTGNMYIRGGGGQILMRANSSEDGLVIKPNGAVELFHDDNKRLETYGNGIIVYGPEGGGGLLNIYADEGDDNADKWRLHANPNGSFYLQNYSQGSWHNNISGAGGGAAILYHNNVNVFETNSGGCKSSFAGANTFTIGSTDASGAYLVLDGDSNGDGTGSDYCAIVHGTDGDLSIHADNPAGDAQFELYTGSGTTIAMIAEAAGEVQLYYNGSQKFNTVTQGGVITGDLGVGDASNPTHQYDQGIHVHANGTGAVLHLTDGTSGSGTGDGFDIISHAGTAYLWQRESADMVFGTQNNGRWRIDSSGHLKPYANNTYDIGTSSVRVRNIYTNDLNLSNKGSTNSVDNTWGDYTIQEGESDLFLINNRSGKKYKFNLTEVS